MTARQLKTVLYVAVALAAGLALRLWFLIHAARIDGDTLLYGNIARNWMQQGVYSFTPSPGVPVPTLIRLPGYPLFLMLCFRLFGVEHYTAVLYVQCVIDLLTCLLLAALAGRLFGRRSAMVALVLSALCPFMAAYTAAPLTEVLTLFCITLTFYSVVRWRDAAFGFNRWLWLTAFAMSYSVLLRPEQGLLAATVVPAMFWMARRQTNPNRPILKVFLPIAVAAFCVVLPLSPWAVRNWRTFHVVQVLAPRYATDPGEMVSLGFQRWYRTWAIDFASTEEVYWNYDSAPIWIGDLPSRAFDSDSQYAQTQAILDEYNRDYNATRALDARFQALAEQRIHNDPIRYYLALPVARLLNMAFRPRAEMLEVPLEWWRWSQHQQTTLLAGELAALNFGYFLLGGIGLWLWRQAGWGENLPLVWAMLGFVILRCLLLLTLDNSEPRYTLEFFPLLILWGSFVFHLVPTSALKIEPENKVEEVGTFSAARKGAF
jgi:4-amino-4-deoxy-L-arabinose transferase-like glycosyltransferase